MIIMDSSNTSSFDFDHHFSNLSKICRLCGQMKVYFSGPKKGCSKNEHVKHIKKLWSIDVSSEDDYIFPTNICYACSRKLKVWYHKVSKRKKCCGTNFKMTDFSPHDSVYCKICLTVESDENKTLEEVCFFANTSEANSKDRSDVTTRSKFSIRSFTDSYSQTDIIGGRGCGSCTCNSASLFNSNNGNNRRNSYEKQKLKDISLKHAKQSRLKSVVGFLDQFCEQNKENKVEILFFLLLQALRDAGDRKRHDLIDNVWNCVPGARYSLTEDECLAKRVMLKQTKDQYKKEHHFYKNKLSKPVTKSLNSINKLEKTFYPEYTEFLLTKHLESADILQSHTKTTVSEVHRYSKEDNLLFNICVRWDYITAVTKTLEEIISCLEGKTDVLFSGDVVTVYVNDYIEDKNQLLSLMNIHSENRDNVFNAKLTTYYLRISKLSVINDVGSDDEIYHCSNDVYNVNRPFLRAYTLRDSDADGSFEVVRKERKFLMSKLLHINSIDNVPGYFKIMFSTDEPTYLRNNRNTSGLTHCKSNLKRHSTPSLLYTTEQELRHLWMTTSRRLLTISRLVNQNIRCSQCRQHGHNIKRCSKKRENFSSLGTAKHKKLRTAPNLHVDQMKKDSSKQIGQKTEHPNTVQRIHKEAANTTKINKDEGVDKGLLHIDDSYAKNRFPVTTTELNKSSIYPVNYDVCENIQPNAFKSSAFSDDVINVDLGKVGNSSVTSIHKVDKSIYSNTTTSDINWVNNHSKNIAYSHEDISEPRLEILPESSGVVTCVFEGQPSSSNFESLLQSYSESEFCSNEHLRPLHMPDSLLNQSDHLSLDHLSPIEFTPLDNNAPHNVTYISNIHKLPDNLASSSTSHFTSEENQLEQL